MNPTFKVEHIFLNKGIRLSFTKSSFITFITSVSILILGLTRNIFIARTLGSTIQGQFNILFIAVVLLTTFGSLGIGNANIYFLGKKKEDNDAVIGNLLIFFIVISIILFSLYYILQDKLINKEEQIENISIISASFLIPLVLFHSLFIGIFLGKKLIIKYNIFLILQQLILLLLIVGIYFLSGLSLFKAVVALLSSFFIVDLTVVFLLRRVISERLRFKKGLLLESIKFGFKSQIANILQYFNYRLDFLIIWRYIDSSQVAYYNVASLFAEVLSKIPGSISIILFPEISSKEKKEDISRLTEKVCRITLFLTICAGVGIILLGGFFIKLFYPEDFSAAVNPMKILVPGIAALSVANILSSNLIGRGYPHFSSFCSGFGLVVTVILDLLLIPRYHIIGAAIASTASYFTSSIVMLILYSFKTDLNLQQLLIIKKEDIAMIISRIKQLIHQTVREGVNERRNKSVFQK